MVTVYLQSKSETELTMTCETCKLNAILIADRTAREIAQQHIRDRHGSGVVKAFGFEFYV